MADGAPKRSAARDAPNNAEPLPAIRERVLVIDDFLPVELAEAMRADIDAHFSDPQQHKPDTHQVWNYWFVQELYAYLRTQPEKVIDEARVRGFHEHLRGWSMLTLGLGGVTWPYLSLYVPGCRQNLHNDSVNGRFGFVFSLTRNERRTIGGETIVHREGDPFRALSARPGAGGDFYEAIAPRFNRLVVFDDRLPHAVERIEGSMDPLEGRFVLHGHISEQGPAAAGALPPAAAVEPARAAIAAFTTAHFVDGYQGLISVQLDILPDGSVADCRLLLDRVIHADARDTRWPGLARALLAQLAAARFPAADGPTRLMLPIVFGAPVG
jgi:hypothetical protein